jgi:hypothetical protein
MKLKIFFSCLILILLLFSCEKEDQLSVIIKPDTPLLLKILNANQPYYEYSYNTSNLINSEISKFQFTLFKYNSSNQLMRTDSYWDNGLLNAGLVVLDTILNRIELVNPLKATKSGSIEFTYNNTGQLIKSIMIEESGTNSEFSVFTYNQENRISRQTLYWENIISGYIEYSYDVKGNLIEEILYQTLPTGSAVLNSSTKYEYDDKSNPFKSINNLVTPGLYTNQNNITKETLTIFSEIDRKAINEQVTQNLYGYNANGLPVDKNGTVKFIYQ